MAATEPTLPTPATFAAKTLPERTGTLFTPANGAALATALTDAAADDPSLTHWIQLTAGVTYTQRITIPAHAGPGWIVILSSAYASLPAVGTRVGTSHVSN